MDITRDTAAVVTGGASGLGEASARALAAAGARVTIFDLNADKGAAIAAEIEGLFCKVNVTDEDSVVAGFEAARATHGQERILVHCAQTSRGGKTVGRDRENGGFKRFSTVDYEYSILGILVASYRLASLSALGMAGLEPLEDGERGVITLTASAAAQDAQVGQVGYGSGKAGVNGLVLPMARDLMELGIRVNSIMPGIFATPPMLGVPAKVLDVLSASVPFPKRPGKPSEFGSLVLELIRNSYFNAQALRLDGGLRMPPR
ncbi:3-hydroxyacyl-CoA dehydrogenase [Polymorphobacter glacialis]|uniref:3-hydroxyacyl-CoA dehydrogenase n=1 Tax=Sandarakinorhabdus glacialis TaxID=1614636 RepID=A0A917E4W1_9SPHN|nr:SDR family NAD(P)-dependent oxidoreductase [Polymorphobacter glacialis]GGE03862.1 3-hydroxyacyl-CoA dehydrogenase [Polymorphobacter glacialis]